MERASGQDIALPLITELGIIRREAAQRIPWHAHAGSQLLFVLRGTTTYEFKPPGPARVILPGGHFLVIPARREHRALQEVRPPCALCHIVLTAGTARSCRHSPFTARDWRRLEQQFRCAPPAVHPFSPALRLVVTNLARALQSFFKQRADTLAQARLRTLVCAVILEAAGQLGQAAAAHDNAVTAAERYLRQHLGEELLMSDVARQLGLSRPRLFALFKRGTGMTPNDFLLRARVEKAGELLVTTAASVTAIAFETGFGSSQYFSTVFRKYTGQTPGGFRRARI